MAAISDSKTSASSEADRLAGRHALADDQELLQAEGFADLGTRLAADHRGLDFRHVAFQVLRIPEDQQFADDRSQDGVAKEFQAFVRGQAVLGARGVRQGLTQECFVRKRIADPPLAPLQPAGLRLRDLQRFVGRGGWSVCSVGRDAVGNCFGEGGLVHHHGAKP